MPNTMGQAYGLTVLTPILPGRESLLRQYLGALPLEEKSPLAKTPKTHFARWVIIDQLVYEGKPQKRDLLQSQYLLFESNFDGADLDAYIADLCQEIPEEVEAVWGSCVGYPGIQDVPRFQAYIRHNQIEDALFVAAYGDATVAQVRESVSLREQVIQFAIQSQGLGAAELQQKFLAAFPMDEKSRG